ncbi:MAG: diacylglycerol kinase family lipid kinase [Clostridiales bacterium]|nr:diacylglycerol kinase family lipid kinase [Clostridiales bacterium]
MKHIFVINPMAGKGGAVGRIMPDILRYKKNHGSFDYDTYVTKHEGDALDFVRKTCMENENGEELRFYACGGDGTLFEVANGAYGFKNVSVGSIPLGSGNDYIRLYGTPDQFGEIRAQIEGTAIDVDVIKCGNKIAMNQCSMGFDAETCNVQGTFKKLKFMNGESSYLAALLYCFIKKMKNDFTIQIDDDEPFSSTVLFCVAANSRWYGGGFMPAPFAMPDDGEIDVVILKKQISRIKLLGLINKYKEGKLINHPMTVFKRAKRVHIISKQPATVNIDGECEIVTEADFEIQPKAMKFVIPTTSTFIEDKASGKISNEITL